MKSKPNLKRRLTPKIKRSKLSSWLGKNKKGMHNNHKKGNQLSPKCSRGQVLAPKK